MVKGGKRYSSMGNDGKWFAHSVLKENETKTRETSTSTGIMLTQIESSLPQALCFQRYPKRKTEQKTREYRFSDHDNKYSFKDNISVFSHGVGRRKCLDDRRQQNSHFCLCHRGADSNADDARPSLSAYQADFKAKASVDLPTGARRFTHNHRQKSAEAALARAGEQFFWFGRDDSALQETLEVLAAAK
ncbi:testis-expressed protein 36 [Salarias fasciatus]|uniref:testis-expressed protein 36 n=1 Tax=Salarias fasciatus TaxID=181472 RepID=UPI001176A2D9|nr:testis-expressed protein 36 [Salarias fasciatus]